MTDMLTRAADALAEDAPALQAQLTTQHKRCVIRLRGPMRQDTICSFAALYDRLGRLSFDHVIVDLKGVTDVDEAGAKVLLGLHHYVTARRAALTVWCIDPSMATTISTLGISTDRPLSVSR
jgi:anti-anti-sigma regulatory factor